MQIEVRQIGNVTILDFKGKMTLGEVDMLRDQVDKLLDQGVRHLLLNLKDVSCIDNAGLDEIVRNYISARQAGGSFKFMKVTKRVMDLFAITKFLTIFQVFEDEQEALESF